MKLSNLLSTAVGLMCAVSASATDAGSYDVVRLDPMSSRYSYRPNEVIVKFKEGSPAKVKGGKNKVASGVSAVDEALRSLGVTEAESLMPLSGSESFPKKARSYAGTEVKSPVLNNAYLFRYSAEKSVEEAVSALAELGDVEYAEPNYMVFALGEEADINDPYYELQYGIADINLRQLWGQPVISKEGPVIAIIDTGVDISHPDLKANIWTNEAEARGASGYDDDRNGFTDDLHGWDFVNQTGVILDFNGHGTHCAGIAAAVGRNGLGIIGANPHARIMPLTAMQSNGTGDIATIIKAIDYAAANGAQVISMSLGTYSYSIALEQALGRAYQKAVIVAAAGNDGYCLNHAHPERGQSMPMPMFPGAFTFVLGVQATSDGDGLAGFSNFDDNGPVFSAYGEEKFYNYELKVPGVGIMSTFPNGQYKRLNGTSMATPLVAGAVSRLLQSKEYTNKEELFGDLINSTNKAGVLDIFAAYNIKDEDRRPTLQFTGYRLADADGDGRPDAGEVLEFYPSIRNSWGNAKNIRLSIECAETANTFCEFLNTDADFGYNLSTYGKGESLNPLRIKINDNVVDGRVCRLKLIAECDNAETVEQEIEILVENGVELGGILKEDMTLHADQHYIVTSLFGVPEGVTLTIEPGTVIKFRDGAGFRVDGTLIAVGEPGKMITFTKADLDTGKSDTFYVERNKNILKYCIIENLCSSRIFNLTDGIMRNLWEGYTIDENTLISSNIYNLFGGYGIASSGRTYSLTNCNLVNNKSRLEIFYAYPDVRCVTSSNVFQNYIGTKYCASIGFRNNSAQVYKSEFPNYLGTSDPVRARASVVDIHYPGSGSFGEYDLSNMLTRPVAEAHGIVWKVVVDGYDAQDEYDLLPPLGVGRHKFEVYFNRPMNKEKAPMVAMGVRAPYTQNAIAEDGQWNEAGDIYTAWFTLNGRQNIDGVNRIYVAEAEDDEFFEIPVEDQRFNVNVQCAGSLSTGFFGEAGLGRVNLEWEDLDLNFEDIMGYNMYRINPESEEAVMINDRLIEAGTTNFTDYDVKPGKTYQYYYKVMTTDLKENDPSKIIAVTPLTSVLGDANGSGSVDVADVLTTVNFASGMNPKPFIFEAADMNADNDIDILDVVGIINTIMGTQDKSMIQSVAEATLWVEDGTLYVDTPVELAGLQFDFNISKDKRLSVLDALNGFETTGSWVGDDSYRFMAYNLGGKTIPAGRHALLNIDGATVTDARLSDREGANVEVLFSAPTGIQIVDKDAFKVNGALPGVYNIMGQKVGDRLEDLDRLPDAVYIVNGWKVIKK